MHVEGSMQLCRRHDASDDVSSLPNDNFQVSRFLNLCRLRPLHSSKMSFESLQERLSALQETIAQLRELIDRLSGYRFDSDAATEEGNGIGDLSLEISQVLKDGQEELKSLREEAEYTHVEDHDKERLREGVDKLGKDLTRYVTCAGIRSRWSQTLI